MFDLKLQVIVDEQLDNSSASATEKEGSQAFTEANTMLVSDKVVSTSLSYIYMFSSFIYMYLLE